MYSTGSTNEQGKGGTLEVNAV